VAYLTRQRARGAARSFQGHTALAEAELRSFARASSTARFDVFLSHARLDAVEVLGVKNILENQGLTVYVDWIEDPQLDRTHVTPSTAAHLRSRMRQCDSLIFATSDSSPDSKWMPWELGYFDGYKPGHIAVLPLVDTSTQGFDGQEYLGLYPSIEDVSNYGGPSLGFIDATRRNVPVGHLVTSRVTLA
jgi:hypothetical protein